MKICIDVLTPKQALFFYRLKGVLEEKGDQVFIFTRRYREANQVLQMKNVHAKIIGRYGGKSLYGKLIASLERTKKLAEEVADLRVDAAVSFSSPEMARVAFGLKIPNICVNDSPHSVYVAKLTIPLCDRLCTPRILYEKWLEQELCPPEKVVTYNALDCVAWLKGFEPNPKILEDLNLDSDRPIILIRPTESYASYISEGVIDSRKLVMALIERLPDFQCVLLPRYKDRDLLRQMLPERVVIPDTAIDAANLLHFTHIFIGGGGTMTTESCLLGVPTISCFPFEVEYLKYLSDRGLLYNATSSSDVIEKVDSIVENYDEIRSDLNERAKGLLESMEDPIEVIAEVLDKLLE